MSFYTGPSSSGNDPKKVAFAISCMRQGRNAQAFLLLSEPGAEKDPAACFALGLLRLRSGDGQEAIHCFERSLNIIKTASAPRSGMPESNGTYIRLATEQVSESVYLTPMDPDMFAYFPEAAMHTVILALIYVYRKKGADEQVRKLLSGLTGPAFEKYKNDIK
ncbi:MAG: tetratricopeptide repeat-containing protein [Methanomassiliicoccaceae archaeon]|nr:tetratricopeptide repeat-containing protein [Methanomassiliicoccaceae archaeon]